MFLYPFFFFFFLYKAIILLQSFKRQQNTGVFDVSEIKLKLLNVCECVKEREKKRPSVTNTVKISVSQNMLNNYKDNVKPII